MGTTVEGRAEESIQSDGVHILVVLDAVYFRPRF